MTGHTAPPGRPGAAAGPLSDVRVLEVSGGRPARIAGMLLADLGADVVRAVAPDAPPEPLTPGAVCWDRGKRLAPMAAGDVVRAAAAADVLLVDDGPAALRARGLHAEALADSCPDLVHLWLPPYGERGEWADQAEDPLLLAGLGTLAVYYPADDDSPVAPVIASLSHVQGAIGAAAAVAGLVGRQRLGVAQAGVVTGLHAAAAVMGTGFAEIDDGPALTTSRGRTGPPNWRVYECADGEYLFLAALTPDLFIRALEAVDRLDLLALPEVGGDFYAVIDLSRGRRAVNAELEAVFASQPARHWRERLDALRVPCAGVQSRAEWMDGPVVAGNHARLELEHPSLGTVTVPGVPVTLRGTPGAVRGLARPAPGGEAIGWGPRPRRRATAGTAAGTALPLAGVTVVDAASFVAAPMVSTLLADFGADVVKVEAPQGDTYRAYSLSFLAVNQRKRGVALDLKDPAGVRALHGLLSAADVLVENLRPQALADLALGEDEDSPAFPRLVHCSVSAYGGAVEFADAPGFDPIFQCLSGMAVAQGGDGEPVISSAPANDVATGSLGALGALAALYHRESSGRGQRVDVSLAASATFVQSPELTTWAGAPAPQRGHDLFRGPDDGHRYHECSDGWIAVAAVDPASRAGLAAALGIDDLADAAARLRGHSVASATGLLARHGVPVCRVAARPRPLLDPFLVENGFSHLVPTSMGTARVVDRHSAWPQAPEPRPGRFFELGEDTDAVLAAAPVATGGGAG